MSKPDVNGVEIHSNCAYKYTPCCKSWQLLTMGRKENTAMDELRGLLEDSRIRLIPQNVSFLN